MKTNTNTHHTSSRSRSFKMNITLALLAIIFLPLLAVTTSAQGYYRNYTTGAYNVQNEARCIIKPGGGLYKFLSVGQFWEPYLPSSGHAIWAKANGVLDIPTGPLFLPVTNASKYNRVGYQDYSDYSLNFVEETMASGNFNPGSSYTAHPATGVKTYLQDGVLYSNTWTALIDPLTKNTIWDHVIYNAESDISFGIGVVTDPNGFDFYVVSHISNVIDPTLQRVGVTKYEYIYGYNGHQVAWSREYDLDGYTLVPVGIVDAGNDVVVAGNLHPSGGTNQIFTLVIDKATGFISRQIYSSDPYLYYDGVVANSITGPFTPNGEYLIAGKAYDGGDVYPMILSLDAAANFNQYGIYRYKKLANESTYLNGEFNCARMVDQMATENGVSPVSRITAVGRVGYNATFPGLSDAITMNTANLGATPSWTKLHSVDFKGLTGTATNAKWFVPQPNAAGIATLGEYVYIGNQTSGGVYRDVVCGGLRKTDGATECSIDPYFVSVDNPSPEGPYEEAYTLLWGTDESERTISSQIYLTPYHCDRSSPYQFYTISYGKRASDDHEVVSVIEQAEITHNRDIITVTYTNTEENSVKLIITDLLGNALVEQRVQCASGSHEFTLSTQNFQTGPYYVAVISPTSRFNKNIIIVR